MLVHSADRSSSTGLHWQYKQHRAMAHLRQPCWDVQGVTALHQRHMTKAVADCERCAAQCHMSYEEPVTGVQRKLSAGERTDVSSAMFVSRPDVKVQLRASRDGLACHHRHQIGRCSAVATTERTEDDRGVSPCS